MRGIFGLVLVVLFLSSACAWAQEPEARKPVRLLAEAEDFRVEKPGWDGVPFRENHYASTFAITFLSRMGCLGAPEQLPAGQETVAVQGIVVPYADEYELLARYEQPYNYSVEFAIEVVQNGKVVGRQNFGRLQDPKIWALNRHNRVPMERFWWGGTDNIVWQHPGSVRLAAGPATLRLIAAAQMEGKAPRVNAARRNVDVICLTNDKAGMEAQRKTSYLAYDGWLVQDGDLFVRITNPTDGLGPMVPVLAPYNLGQHSPYYIHTRDWATTRVLKSGRALDATAYDLAGPRSRAVRPALLARPLNAADYMKPSVPTDPKSRVVFTVPDDEYLQPGDVSAWVPVGHLMDALHNSKWFPQAIYKEKVVGVHMKLEFAVPDGKGGLRTIRDITLKGPQDYTTTFEIPGNVAPNPTMSKALRERFWLPQIRTGQEALQWLQAEVEKLPKKGPTAKRFLIYSIMGFSGALSLPEGRQLALALGDNTAVNQEGNKRKLVAHWRDVRPEFYEKQNLDDIYVISYGDEIHLPTAKLTDEEFVAWLKAQQIKIDGPVKWTTDRNDPLYYYSVIAGVEQGAKPYIAASAYYKSKGALAGANYSPHANYLVSEMHWIRPFKINALTMPWSEDYVWQIPEFSVQAMGYLTTAFRAGAKYHNQPIHMYVMPHSPGNTPRNFRLSFYTAVAHGSKMVNYFCATPLAVGGTENYIDTNDLPMWREIHNVSHEAGQFEDYVMDGKVRPAKVGLLLSSVDDVLTGVSNSSFAMHNNERKALYYALRHSQVPVDMLSEDDVIDGLANDYNVIYVTQQYLHSRAVDALRRWAENGGTIVALAGGGFQDEFRRANPKVNELFGVKSQQLNTDPNLVSKYLLVENKPFLTKQDLPLYEPIDAVSWGQGKGRIENVPVMVWKQTLAAGDGRVVGTFRDGSPAVIEKTHGKGRAILFGFLPGQAYLKSGLPIRPADRGATNAAYTHYLPTTMDVALRRRLTDDFLPQGFERPVECSVDLVESAGIDTPATGGTGARLAVPLINYTGKPIAGLKVRIPGLANPKSVRSLERGALKAQTVDGATVVTLPLETADMLLIDR